MDRQSLFYPLEQEGLNTLRIQYDWKTNETYIQASKEWDDGFDWSAYNHDFYLESIRTKTGYKLSDVETRALFEKYGLSASLSDIFDLMRQGRHFGIDCFYSKDYDIRFFGCMHNRTRGINNTSHGTMMGGIRRAAKAMPEMDVIRDGLNLSRAMTYKNFAGNLPMGGCKACVMMDALDVRNMQHMGFLAFCLDSIRCATGPDMGFSPEMTDGMKDNGYSVQYTCGTKGPLGGSGKPTAYGLYLAMREAIALHMGKDDLTNMSFAIQGLGQVGWHLVEYLANEVIKPTIYVADIAEANVVQAIEHFTAQGVHIIGVKPDEILLLDVDVIAPCACGGIFDEDTIPLLKCAVIFGAANNQLKASNTEEEYRLARLLAKRGIFYQTDWWHNTAGIMFCYEEFKYQAKASIDRVYADIARLLPSNTRKNILKARELNITPTECAYKMCNDEMYPHK